MPSKVKGNLNQAVVASITAAEINGPTRPFVGVQISNLASQRVLISGLIWSVFFLDPADPPSAFGAELIIQRGAVLGDVATFPQQIEEMLVFFVTTVFADMKIFVPAIPLEPGYSYGIGLDVARRVAFVNGVTLSLTVLGQQVSTTGQAQIELR